ncbi:unnamed protein product [Prunus armeniaca]
MVLMSYVNMQEDTTNKLWYLDSGCNNHMSGDKKLFATLDETFIEKVKLGDNSSLCVKGRGNINIKSEDIIGFKKFKAIVEKEAGVFIKVLRTDRGGEFTSHKFTTFCEENGVHGQLTTAYTPQQNGLRSKLDDKSVPCVMLGISDESKAYKLYNLATKRIIVSIDTDEGVEEIVANLERNEENSAGRH